MSFLKVVGVIGSIVLLWAYCQRPSGTGDVASRQTLSVNEESDRIVLGWSGPVREPMSERVAAAIDRYKADRRRLVLILNSPGGSIDEGRKVVAAIRSRNRGIETLVQKAGVCASMCVSIFLAGVERVADPDAYFMFHQATLDSSAKESMKRQELSASEEVRFSRAVKAIETQATDDFFRNDIGMRGVNKGWLARMRERVPGRDIWMSGQQLVDEGSGIVDRLDLAPAPQRG